jgi:hypothetical protein
MLFNWLNASEAVGIGNALADQFVPTTTPEPAKRRKKGRPVAPDAELQKFLVRIDGEVRPLRLNFYKRAKLANSFKWKLLQNGVEPGLVDELTRILLVRLAGKVSGSPPPTSG